uniref:hypothetical protein n=1 Tax=Rhizobium ruizarguesonis TaxID=2081791 RepID=UPI001FE11B5B|nr:hypothetical protein [Rhizobium ruizarguesonis]
MSGTKKSHSKRDISPTHLNAAAIDIGATMHVAAVRPDKFSEPVRSFGTFTGDLPRLADWFVFRRANLALTQIWCITFMSLRSAGLEEDRAFRVRTFGVLPT